MHNKSNFQNIMQPSTEYDRTETLESLYETLRGNGELSVDTELKHFLTAYVTKDFKQAGLVGLILLHLNNINDKIPLYARLFPALTMYQESNLRRAVVEVMPDITPLQLYEQIAEITISGNPQSADYHYAYLVLVYIDPSTLKGDWQRYLT